jgi:hypothetical protein
VKRSAPRRRVILVLCGLWALLTHTVWAASPHIHAELASWQAAHENPGNGCLLCDLGPLAPPLMQAPEGHQRLEIDPALTTPSATICEQPPQTATTRPRAPPR